MSSFQCRRLSHASPSLCSERTVCPDGRAAPSPGVRAQWKTCRRPGTLSRRLYISSCIERCLSQARLTSTYSEVAGTRNPMATGPAASKAARLIPAISRPLTAPEAATGNCCIDKDTGKVSAFSASAVSAAGDHVVLPQVAPFSEAEAGGYDQILSPCFERVKRAWFQAPCRAAAAAALRLRLRPVD